MMEEQDGAMNTTLAFGEVLWDIMPGGTVLGGAPFNFAYRLHSLGLPVLPVSRLGCDVLGARAYHATGNFGLDDALLQWDDDHPTGTVQVTLDAAGQPDYLIVPDVAYDFIEWTAALQAAAAQAGCICFGTLIQRAPVSRATLGAVLGAAPGALKLLDINLRKECHSPETVRFSLENADILKLNEEELAAVGRMLGMPERGLSGLAETLLEDWNLRVVLVTLGERGVLAVDEGGRILYSPGYQVEVIDPVGSGDAFTAAFVEAYLRGADLRVACERGNALGALVAGCAGGTAPVAKERIEEFMDSGSEIQRRIDPELAGFMD